MWRSAEPTFIIPKLVAEQIMSVGRFITPRSTRPRIGRAALQCLFDPAKVTFPFQILFTMTAGSPTLSARGIRRCHLTTRLSPGSKGECGFLCQRWLTQRSTVERAILTTEFGLDQLLRC